MLLDNPETAAIIKEPLARMSGTSSSLLNDVDLSDSPLGEFMNMMRLADMIKTNSNIVGQEEKIAINEALIKIRKN